MLIHRMMCVGVVASAAGLSACVASPRPQPPTVEAVASELRLERAADLREQGLVDAAVAEFGLALEDNPRLTDAHMGMGDIFRERGNYRLALNAYRRAVNIDPNRYDTHYYLGVTQQVLGQIDEALASYRQAHTLAPNRAEVNRDLASALLQTGRVNEALLTAQRSVDLDPDSQAAWCNLAAAYQLSGEYEQAIDCYREAAELDRLPDAVLTSFADAHMRLGNYPRAINLLSVSVETNPDALSHERLALALFKVKRFDEALEQYQAALNLKPDDISSLNGMGATLMTMYIQSNRRQLEYRERAYEAWRRSVRLDPNQPVILDLMARYSVI